MLVKLLSLAVLFGCGVYVGRKTKQAGHDAEMAALDLVFLTMAHDVTELQDENHRLKQVKCHCAEHLESLKRLN